MNAHNEYIAAVQAVKPQRHLREKAEISDYGIKSQLIAIRDHLTQMKNMALVDTPNQN